MQVQDARVQEICSHLQDDVSRFIFEKRLMFSLTSDYRWIQEIIERAECMQSLHAELHREERKRFLFGAGRLGRTMALLAPECWLGIADNDPEKQGKKLYGVDIVSPEMLRQHPDAEIYVAICGDQKDFISEIVSQIKDLGFSADQIHFLDGIHGAMVAGQYFDLSDLPHDRDEVFVDAGSYDGGTSQQFVQWAGGDYHHIYAFESNPESLPKCEKGLAQISKEKTTLIPYGVWKNRGELHFASLDHDMMQVDEQGGSVCM